MISDDEIASICASEIETASDHSELSEERSTALDYYLGEPYGDEVEGRSQIRTREVLDTVESIMPSLCRVFADVDNIVEFDPVGPEDEELAIQESDRVSHAFWKENRGFYNVYTFCKDALLSKTGIFKVWYDESESEEREEYHGLDDFEMNTLMTDETSEREIIEFEQLETGYHVIFKTRCKYGKIKIVPVPPEEFGISRTANSPYAQDATFCFHRTRKTYSDLIKAGYSKKLVDSLPMDDDDLSEERLSRRHLDIEDDTWNTSSHKSMNSYWVSEAYIHIDRNDDGIAELLKVTLASRSGRGYRLLDIEEVDAIPFFTAPPNLLTHKFYGLSIADLVMDIQRIKSSLLRQLLDNSYLANNIRTAVNERVNLDDLLTARPGGVVRVQGDSHPMESVAPLVSPPLPPETFNLLGYLDEARKDRTGSGDEVPGLDAKSLASVNTGVAALAYDQSRARIELIARILAEVGFKPLFKFIHELLLKHSNKAEVLKLRGRWIQVNPSEWKTRYNMTVQVGLGIASKERRMMALDAIAQKQAQVVSGGGFGTLLMPNHLYQMLHDYTNAWGLEPTRYFQDPKELPPQPPKPPSIEEQALMAQAQAQLGQVKTLEMRNQVEAAKIQSQERIRIAELQSSQRELESKRQIELLKGDLQRLKDERAQAANNQKAAFDFEIKAKDQMLEMANMRLKNEQENDKRQIEMYKALLQSGTSITTEQMRLAGASEGGAEGMFTQVFAQTANMVKEAFEGISNEMKTEIGGIKAHLIDQMEANSAPKVIERDENGMILSIGGKKVERDNNGRISSIQ